MFDRLRAVACRTLARGDEHAAAKAPVGHFRCGESAASCGQICGALAFGRHARIIQRATEGLLTRALARGIQTHLHAGTKSGRRVIQDVQWPVHQLHVAHEVAALEHGAQHGGFVVHRHALVHGHDHLGPRHLSRAPHAAHQATPLKRVCLADAHERRVVEAAESRQVVVVHVVHDGLQQRQEDALGGLAQPVVLLGRQAHDGGRIHRVARVRDGGHLHHRVSIGQRIETGVIAEGALEHRARSKRLAARRIPVGCAALGADPALDHDLAVGGHAQRHGLRAHHGNAAAVQEAAHQQFADAWWQWGGCAVGHHALAAKADGDRHALAQLLPAAPVRGAVVMQMPVHGQRGGAKQLAAVHADVVAGGLGRVAIVGMDGVHAGQRDVAPLAARGAGLLGAHRVAHRAWITIQRPALDDGQASQVHFAARCQLHHFLRATASHRARTHAKQRQEFPRLRDDLAQRARWLRLGQARDAVGHMLEAARMIVHAQRHLHATRAAEQVHGQRKVATLHPLEQHGLAAERCAHGVECCGTAGGVRASAA